MKLLRNPIAVTALAVLAGVYTLWTILGARGFRSNLATAATTTANGAAVPVPSPSPEPRASSNPGPGVASNRAMDHEVLSSRVQRWLEAPLRDPFRMQVSVPSATNGPSAAQLLTLRAVWRQSGSALAVVNGQILREGDQVQGFDLESIEADAVWVRSTQGRERVTFSVPNPALSHITPAAPAPSTENITAAIPVAPHP